MRAAVLAGMLGVGAFGATPLVTDTFPNAAPGANWTTNGTIAGAGPGLVS